MALAQTVLTACAGADEVAGRVTPLTPQSTASIPTPTLASAAATPVAAEASSIDDPLESSTAGPITPTPTLAPATSLAATPTRDPALDPEESLVAGATAVAHEDYAAAAELLAAGLDGTAVDSEAYQETLLSLAVSQLQEKEFGAAAENLNRYLAIAAGGQGNSTAETAIAYFYLGQAYAGLGDAAGAIGAFEAYLKAHEDMAAYVQPLIAELWLAGGDREAATAAYEAALTAGAQRLWEVNLRLRLAELYTAQELHQAAQQQYDAVYELAVTENTRAEMTYLAGKAALLAGDPQTGFARFLRGIEELPRAYDSYLGLVELVAAGVEVDPYQRGLVDYYAGAYDPAIEAFTQYLEEAPEVYRPDAHLYLAWSYEALGDVAAARAEIDRFADYGAASDEVRPSAVQAQVELADLLARNGGEDEALTIYEDFLAERPTDEAAPHVAWQIGAEREQLGDLAGAQAAFAAMAEAFPEHEDAPTALLRAGWLAYDIGAVDQAREIWQQLVERYPASAASEEAFVWLLRTTPAAEAEPLAQQVISNTRPSGYFALRARELVRGEAPFTPPAGYQFEFDDQQAREEAETWLAGWLPGLSVTSTLTVAVTQDSRFVRGEKLWEIGLRKEAREEFESLRADYAFDALTSYQLALYFRDLGAYRSSIGAAASVLALSGQTVFEAPPLIGRLLYPAYYADLILPLAEQYGYDPLLQFALVRQESLFESFAESYVGASGLSQVMPATGADIAGRLNWPDFETEDLTRPIVGLTFGAYYIATQLDYFEDYAHVALSAYNAGPGNAARWYEIAGGDLDLYLRTVDFAETRLYIRRIYEGYQYYRFLYGVEEPQLR